jgi:hypothetical protein
MDAKFFAGFFYEKGNPIDEPYNLFFNSNFFLLGLAFGPIF